MKNYKDSKNQPMNTMEQSTLKYKDRKWEDIIMLQHFIRTFLYNIMFYNNRI